MKRRLLSVSILLVVLAIVAGCGNPAQRAAEKAVESALSTATGGRAKVDTRSGELTITGEDGEQVTWRANEAGHVPAEFPLPVPADWRSEGVVTQEIDGNVSWIINFQFSGDVRTVADRYEQELQKMGLETQRMVMEDEKNLLINLTTAGTINGQEYGGVISFSDLEGENRVNVIFGEAQND